MAVWQRRWVASTNRTQSGHLRASWITVAWIGSQFTFSLCRDALHRTSRVASYTLRVRTEAFECFFLFFFFLSFIESGRSKAVVRCCATKWKRNIVYPEKLARVLSVMMNRRPDRRLARCAWNVIFQRGKVVERKVIETKSFVWFHFSSRVDRLPTE